MASVVPRVTYRGEPKWEIRRRSSRGDIPIRVLPPVEICSTLFLHWEKMWNYPCHLFLFSRLPKRSYCLLVAASKLRVSHEKPRDNCSCKEQKQKGRRETCVQWEGTDWWIVFSIGGFVLRGVASTMRRSHWSFNSPQNWRRSWRSASYLDKIDASFSLEARPSGGARGQNSTETVPPGNSFVNVHGTNLTQRPLY